MKTLGESFFDAMEYAYVAGTNDTASIRDTSLRSTHWREMAKSFIEDSILPNASTSNDFTLRELQTNLPWSIRYSTDFRSSPVTHKDFAHALTHVLKAAGTLAAVVDRMDHDRSVADEGEANRAYCGKYLADLVICALRMANTLPGGVLDLQKAVQDRLETKNDIKLEK